MITSVQPRGIVRLNTTAYTCAHTCMGMFCSDDGGRGYFMNGNYVHSCALATVISGCRWISFLDWVLS